MKTVYIDKKQILEEVILLSTSLEYKRKELTPRSKKSVTKVQVRDFELTEPQKAVLQNLQKTREVLSSAKEREITTLNEKIGDYAAFLEQSFCKGHYRDRNEGSIDAINGFIARYQVYQQQPKIIASPAPLMQVKAATSPAPFVPHKRKKEVVALPVIAKEPFFSSLGLYALKMISFALAVFSGAVSVKFINKELEKPEFTPASCIPVLCAGASFAVAYTIGGVLLRNEREQFFDGHKTGKHRADFAERLTTAKEARTSIAR